MIYDLSMRGKRPIYEYLYMCIRDDILSGKIAGGEKLMSKRALAEQLKISVVSVENAYEQLESEGYIYSRPRSGFFAEKIENPWMLGGMPQPDAAYAGTEEEPEPAEGERLFPLSVWSKLTREVMAEKDMRLLSPVPNNGVYSLRSAIADYLYRIRGMNVCVENIVVGAGSEYLYQLLIQLLGRDKLYAAEEPGYRRRPMIYFASGARFCFLKTDSQGVDISSLNGSGTDVLLVSPNHHYPTGSFIPARRRAELLLWASGSDSRFIIEDDYDSEFNFSGRPIPTLSALDSAGKVIYMNTFSKTISPSMRIAYMVLPPALMKKFNEKLGFYSSTVPSLEQYTLARFISRGYFERHISRMKKYYAGLRREVLGIVSSRAEKGGLRLMEYGTGLHFLLEAERGAAQELKGECGESRMLSECYYGEYPPSAERTFVLDYSEQSVGLIKRLAEILDKQKNAL